MNITWADHTLISGAKITEAPPNRSHNGYGGKIPTRYMLRYSHRWHRVYMAQYSNSGTAYITSRRADLILELETEHLLDALVEGVAPPTPINSLLPGSRFRFHHGGNVATLTQLGAAAYGWHDWHGDHVLHTGEYRLTGRPAWPHVYPTTDPETEKPC